MTAAVYAFEVWLKGHEEHPRVINHRSLGKAKYSYLLDISDCFNRLPFDLVRGRRLGPPQTTEKIERTAKYRGRPELRAGTRVIVGKALGYIVDSNSGANFDVLFDDDSEYMGAVLNVHPGEIVTVAV